MTKTNIVFAFIVATFVLLIGCVTTPYSRPSYLPLKGIIRTDTIKTDTTHSLADISWRNFYTDTNLQKLIIEALDSNLDVRLAINRLQQQAQYVIQSSRAFLPSFNLGMNGSMTTYSEHGFLGTAFSDRRYLKDIQLSLGTSWEIDIWGKLRSARKSQQAIFLEQQATLNAIYTQLIATIASMYYQLIILDNQKKITLHNVDSYTKYLKTVEHLKASAKTNEVAVLQAKAQLANAQAYLPQLEASIVSNENTICSLLGKASVAIQRSDSINIEKIFYDSLSIGVPIQLLSHRPDVQAAEQGLISAHQLYNVAKANMYPQLVLSGNVGVDATSIQYWFNLPGSIFFNLAGGLIQPLFNRRQLKTQKEVARLQEDASLIAFKQTIINAGKEISTTLSNIHYYTQQAGFQQQQIKSLQEAYEYSQQLLIDGYATYLDVLSAQNNILSSTLAVYNTYNYIIQQKIMLYRALGGGWQ